MTPPLGTKPLILYPAPSEMPFNWSHESAWGTAGDANNWGDEGGGGSVRSNTYALFGSYSGKFTGGASQTALCRVPYSSSTWGTVNAGPYCFYFWVYPTAYTGSAAVRANLDLTEGSGAALSAGASNTITDYPISSMTLGAWNLVRVVAPALTTAQQATFDEIDLRVALVPNGGTATFYTDGHQFGYAVDFAALTGAGSQTGAGFVHPYKIRKHVPTDFEHNQYGIHWGRRYNTGYRVGEIETTGFSNTSKETWSKFIDKSATGSKFMLMYDRSDLDLNFIEKAVMDQDDDGLHQIKGTPNWAAKLRWKEQIS